MAQADFFLDAANSTDDFSFLAPMRPAKVDLFIDGIPTFQAMEKAIAGAQKCVYITFWIFGPQVPLQAKRDVHAVLRSRKILRDKSQPKTKPLLEHEPPPTTWGQLLGTMARAGVDVRVLLSDFDPIVSPDNHRAAWKAYRALVAEAGRGTPLGTGTLQVVCSRHEAFITRIQVLFLSARADRVLGPALDRLIVSHNNGNLPLEDMPGLWPSVSVNASGTATKRATPDRLFVASHHQKFIVVDDQIAFCGGLDVNTGRVDSPSHDKMLWHDIDCRVEGDLAGDLRRTFIDRWNREAALFNTFIDAVNAAKPPRVPLLARKATPAAVTAPLTKPVTGGAGQLLRTVARADGPGMPEVVRKDIELAYEKAIAHAERFVYIENQYVREPRLRDLLIARATAVTDLVVVVVVPVAPEEMRPSETPDEVTLKGLYEQHRILSGLKGALGARFGVFSPIARSVAAKSEAEKAVTQLKSLQVYVHSKVLIIDDVFAIVGSANAARRSFRVDTEACVSFFDATVVRDLRLRLWGELLGNPPDLSDWAPATFVEKWTAIATQNASARATSRRGFIVPHDIERFPGQDSAVVPVELAEVYDTGPDRGYVLPV